ncbi:MAG TPA: flagellar motor protein MotB [Leptospiraceae bacterium]|jgi:chemotaxis protein MotB|nr:flagellar motor protein MotB [Leptospiraceae bacterium]HNJ35066.1 flagellar motor protein MotB [Leptospiraceae bacterium]
MRLFLLAPLLVVSCVSSSTYENDMKAKNAEISRLSEEKAALAKKVQETETKARARSADIEVSRTQFKALADAGNLKLKLVDGRVVVVLSADVLFSTGSAELSDKGKAAVSDVAKVCATMKDKRFQVEGHTDNVQINPVPGFPYGDNWELGSARAVSVVNVMIAAGVNPDRVSAASFADTRPIASNDQPEGRAQNRRIEIILTPDLSQVPGFEYLKEAPPADTKPGEPKPQ